MAIIRVRGEAIPLIANRDIHSLADNLKDDPTVRLFSGVNHAFASVGRWPGAGARLSRNASRDRGVSAAYLHVLNTCVCIVPMAMNVTVTTAESSQSRRRWLAASDRRRRHQVGTVEPTDRQQDLERHVPPEARPADSGGSGLQPRLDPMNLAGDQITLLRMSMSAKAI